MKVLIISLAVMMAASTAFAAEKKVKSGKHHKDHHEMSAAGHGEAQKDHAQSADHADHDSHKASGEEEHAEKK